MSVDLRRPSTLWPLLAGIAVGFAVGYTVYWGFNASSAGGKISAIGGVIYVESDHNGAPNQAELGVDKAKVELWFDLDNNNIMDQSYNRDRKVKDTTTGANGSYIFDTLSSGCYFVYLREPTHTDESTVNPVGPLCIDGLGSNALLVNIGTTGK